MAFSGGASADVRFIAPSVGMHFAVRVVDLSKSGSLLCVDIGRNALETLMISQIL